MIMYETRDANDEQGFHMKLVIKVKSWLLRIKYEMRI